MQLDWLADALRDEGCQVEEHTGWETRTMRPFIAFQPVGILDHHTAGSAVLPNYPDPPFYANGALEDKCNLTIRPDGVVVTLNAGWAFDSGLGDRKVLEAVKADAPLPPPTDTYKPGSNPPIPAGSNPGIGGNAWYIDIEVQHLGNGTPIVPEQRDALIRANAAICRHLSWDPLTRVIGHREWTTRKTDPRWDGNTNPMPGIREDTAARLGDDMPLTPEDIKAVAKAVWQGHLITHPVSGEQRGAQALLADSVKYSSLAASKVLELTPAQIAAIADHISEEVADDVATELAERLKA